MILKGSRTIVATACAVAPRTLSGSVDFVVVVLVVVTGPWPPPAAGLLGSVVTAPPSALLTLVTVVVLSPLEHPSTTAQDAKATAKNTPNRFIPDLLDEIEVRNASVRVRRSCNPQIIGHTPNAFSLFSDLLRARSSIGRRYTATKLHNPGRCADMDL
jgi:hypothetical protein